MARKSIFERDNYICHYCKRKCEPDHWEKTRHPTIDHIFPKSKGGIGHESNLVTACWGCNYAKGDKVTDEAYKLRYLNEK